MVSLQLLQTEHAIPVRVMLTVTQIVSTSTHTLKMISKTPCDCFDAGDVSLAGFDHEEDPHDKVENEEHYYTFAKGQGQDH